jgi:DNA-binding transcriptional LysR family regulator
MLYDYAKKIEAQSSIIERKIINSADIKKHYSIGATLTIGEYVLPYILGEYRKFNGNNDITMHVFNTEIVSKMLSNGEIDMGIVEGPFDRAKFRFYKLSDDELVFVVSPQNPLAGSPAVELEEILKSRLILREYGSGTRKVLEDKLFEMGVSLSRLKPYMEIGSIGAIKSLVELNLGCTIISKAAVQRECASGSLAIIPIKDIRIMRSFNFIFMEDSPSEFINSFTAFALGTEK